VILTVHFLQKAVAVADHIKIDWHDHKLIEAEAKQKGIGEEGKPAFLSVEDNDKKEELYKVNGFNGLLSDRIALNRSLPDIRHKG
jgi:polypeptide N-acetylgalactosaminyltransferase